MGLVTGGGERGVSERLRVDRSRRGGSKVSPNILTGA